MAQARHAGQVDKAGQDYILHPLRVMAKVQHPDAKIVAVLHDILEDTATTAEELHTLGFSQQVIAAIQALTKVEGEHRLQAVQRTVQHPLAVQVKLADVADNMDLSRLSHVTAKDLKRMQQYRQVQAILQRAQRFYHVLAQLDLDPDYPVFQYSHLRHNYQYLLNACFDAMHEIGGCEIGLPQEWWILFEDVSHYLAYCDRQHLQPKPQVFFNLIHATDQVFFGGAFQSHQDQHLFAVLFDLVQLHFFREQ